MPVQATLSASPTQAAPGQQLAAILTLLNTGTAAVQVVGIQPITYVASNSQAVSSAHGMPAITPGMNVTVPAGGTLNFYWPESLFAPQGGWGGATPTSFTYSLSAVVLLSDGSTVYATPQTVQVVPLASTQPVPGPPFSVQTFPGLPTVQQPLTSPLQGQLRFDVYQESGLLTFF